MASMGVGGSTPPAAEDPMKQSRKSPVPENRSVKSGRPRSGRKRVHSRGASGRGGLKLAKTVAVSEEAPGFSDIEKAKVQCQLKQHW